MATKSSYATQGDLKLFASQVLGLLSERDTNINTNKTDISLLKQAIEDLDCGLHYVGTTTTLPTTADNGALYKVTGSTSTSYNDGWYFYATSSTAWMNLASGGTDEDAVHYMGETTAVITTPNANDMYYFNVPATTASGAITGMKLWDNDALVWRTMGSVSTSDLAIENIDFTTEIDQ